MGNFSDCFRLQNEKIKIHTQLNEKQKYKNAKEKKI